MKRMLDEGTVRKIYAILLEKFGEPIGKAKNVGPGIADERGGRSHKGKSKESDNCGWGADFESVNEGVTCDECGAMMPMEGDACDQCGMMAPMDEDDSLDQMKLGVTMGGGGTDYASRHSAKNCDDCHRALKPTGVRNGSGVCAACKTDTAPKRDLNLYRGPVKESEDGGRHPGHASSCTCPDCSRPEDDELLHDDKSLDEKSKGPSKKGAKSFIKGTKKFSDKVAKAKRAGAKNPEGLAAWMMHKATGKWPSKK